MLFNRRSFGRLFAAVPLLRAKPEAVLQQPEAKPSPAAERLADVLFARYGDRFNEEQRKEILKAVGSYEKDIAAVRAFHLNNADEAFEFRPYREDGHGG